MINSSFRAQLNSYEETLAQWVKFSSRTCGNVFMPNGLEQEEDGSWWLIYTVGDYEPAIKCRDGKFVRLLKLGLDRSGDQTIH